MWFALKDPYESFVSVLKGRAANLICCLIFLVALTACTRHGSERPPQSTQQPPIYPGAINVNTQKQGTSPNSETYISYETDAEANKVLDFYKDKLIGDQWQIYEGKVPGQLKATWAVGCPFYSMDIKTLTIGKGKTGVDLTLVEQACE